MFNNALYKMIQNAKRNEKYNKIKKEEGGERIRHISKIFVVREGETFFFTWVILKIFLNTWCH